MSLDAVDINSASHLDTYNLFGTMQSNATADYYQMQNKKTLIFSDYGSAGIGKFAAMQQTAELTYKSMSESVISTMMSGMMGVALTGSPICGAQGIRGTTTMDETLCLKWYHLGALQPFSRLFVDESRSYPNDPFEF